MIHVLQENRKKSGVNRSEKPASLGIGNAAAITNSTKGWCAMKSIYKVVLFACVLAIIVGMAIAGKMTGDVSAVNSETGTVKTKEHVKVPIAC